MSERSEPEGVSPTITSIFSTRAIWDDGYAAGYADGLAVTIEVRKEDETP